MKKDFFRKLPILETERIILRNIHLNDYSDIFEYASIEETSKYTTWYPHKSPSDSREFIKSQIFSQSLNKPVNWAMELKKNAKMIGTCGFMSFNDNSSSVEIGYVLSPFHQGKGYMTEAMKRIFEYTFIDLDINEIIAHCFVENHKSENVMVRLGMKSQGVKYKFRNIKGKLMDLKAYSLQKNEWK